MNSKLRISFLCLLLVGTILLISCAGTEDGLLPQATTPTTERTEVTTAQTQPPMVSASNLQPSIESRNVNMPLSRLEEPLTVNIDEETTIDLQYQGWPTICKGEGTTLYAVSSVRLEHIDPFGAIALCESHDNGETWSRPRVVIDTVLDDRDAGVVYLGDGKLLVSWFNNDGQEYINGKYSYWKDFSYITDEQEKAYIKSFENLPLTERQKGSYVALSEDYGKTWGDPVRVPISAPHGPTLGKDGRTLIYFGTRNNPEAAGFSSYKTGRELYVIKSIDYGRTWQHLSAIEMPRWDYVYCEPHMIQLSDGSYVGAVRVHTVDREIDENQGMAVYITTSKNGKNWTKIQPITEDMRGGPPHLLQLQNGVVLLTYGYREMPCGIRYRLSYDGGKTWTEEDVIATADDSKNGDMGYPSTVETSDGTLITVYYQRFRSDHYASFLYTKWKLEEAEPAT